MGLLSLIAAIIVGAVAGGLMLGADRLGFYLVLLMPLLAGALVGFATYMPVVRTQARTAPLIVVALIGCLVALTVYWGGSYITYLDDTVAFIQEDSPKTTREEALELIDTYHQSEYNTTGFMGYLSDYAASGLSITRSFGSSSGSGIELQGTTAYGFFALEALLLIGAAVVTVARRHSTNFYKRYAKPNPAA